MYFLVVNSSPGRSVPAATNTLSTVSATSMIKKGSVVSATSQRTSSSLSLQRMRSTLKLASSPDIAIISSESPSPDIGVEAESQSSLGAGIGGGVAAAVLLLLLVAVLGVTLLLVWRRKHTSKAVLQPAAADGGMPQLENPVYNGECRSDCLNIS